MHDIVVLLWKLEELFDVVLKSGHLRVVRQNSRFYVMDGLFAVEVGVDGGDLPERHRLLSRHGLCRGMVWHLGLVYGVVEVEYEDRCPMTSRLYTTEVGWVHQTADQRQSAFRLP
jgi:hypothetical protein